MRPEDIELELRCRESVVASNGKQVGLMGSFKQSAKDKEGWGTKERVEGGMGLTTTRERWNLGKCGQSDQLASGTTE